MQLISLIFAFLAIQRLSAQTVKITLSSDPSAPPVNFVEWELTPGTNFDLFCIGDPGIQQLGFKCMDCNGTERMFAGQRDLSSWFSERTAPVPLASGGAGIRLSLQPTGDMNGRTLQCLGRADAAGAGVGQGAQPGQVVFPPSGGSAVVPGAQATAEVQLRLRFSGKPYIVRSDGSPPRFVPNKGNAFYVECQRQELSRDADGNPVLGSCQFTGQLDLRCEANANPAPTFIRWTDGGGQQLVRSQVLSLSSSDMYAGLSVQCHTRMNGETDRIELSSSSVLILPFEIPTLFSNNYKTAVPENNIISLNEAGSPKMVELQCNVIGSPAPTVFWFHNSGTGISGQNATCIGGKNDQVQAMRDGRWGVSSKCTIALSNYTSAGDYWCVPCVRTAGGSFQAPGSVSNGQTLSNPISTMGVGANGATNFQCAAGLDLAGRVPSMPNWLASIEVTGPPMMFEDQPFRVTQQNGATKAVIEGRYCALPEPGRSDVKWFVNGEEVIAGGPRVGNYLALQPKPNGTTPGCYVAVLQIEPVTQKDLDGRFEFYTRNIISAKRMSFDLETLLNPSSEPVGGAEIEGWWIALIVLLVLAVLFCFCCVFFCFVKRVCCFAPRVSKRPTQSSSGYSSSANTNKDNKYLSNIAPEHLSSEPAPGGIRPQPNLHYTNGYNSNPRGLNPDPEDGWSQADSQTTEAFNFAVLDLQPENNTMQTGQVPPRPPRPAAYDVNSVV